MQEFNVQFKSLLNQLSLSLSHVAYQTKRPKKNQKNKTDQQLSPEMVIKIREIRGERPRWAGFMKKVSFESGVEQRWSDA